MEVAEHHGGTLYEDQTLVLSEIINVDKNYDPDDKSNQPTAEELTEFKATAHNEAFAIAFFKHLDKARYGDLINYLENQLCSVRISTHVSFHLPSQLSTATLNLV